MSALKDAAGEPLRVDAYVRVSRVNRRRGERFISPSVQREEIEAWAQARDVLLLRVFEELDESGMRADRPLLEEVVRRVEEGITHGFVVAKVDRFSRSLTAGMAAVERVRDAGGTFFAVRDGLDSSTDSGRLVLRIMLSLAEWQMERIRTGWEQSREKAIARGVYLARTPPVGYRRLRSGRLRPDPATAAIVTEVFERRAAGASVVDLARFLEQRGVLTSLGNPGWTFQGTRGMLGNRVYLGEVRWGEVRWGPYLRVGAHDPLTEPDTWELAQRPLRVTRPGSARPSLLAGGLVRCAGCSMMLHPVYPERTPGDGRIYACRGRSARGRCPAPASIAAHALEPFVETVALVLLARRRGKPDRELANARARMKAAQAALISYRDADAVLVSLGPEAFARGIEARAQRLRDARLTVAAIRARHRTHDLPDNAELERCWPSLPLDARRDVLTAAIDCVFVAPRPPTHPRSSHDLPCRHSPPRPPPRRRQSVASPPLPAPPAADLSAPRASLARASHRARSPCLPRRPNALADPRDLPRRAPRPTTAAGLPNPG